MSTGPEIKLNPEQEMGAGGGVARILIPEILSSVSFLDLTSGKDCVSSSSQPGCLKAPFPTPCSTIQDHHS